MCAAFSFSCSVSVLNRQLYFTVEVQLRIREMSCLIKGEHMEKEHKGEKLVEHELHWMKLEVLMCQKGGE